MMSLPTLIKNWGTVVASALLLALSGAILAGATDEAANTFMATHGSVNGHSPTSGTFAGYNVIDSTMEWQWSGGCTPDAPHYAMCSGAHPVMEQEVVMNNHQVAYPNDYRWAKYPEGYNTTLPGTVYLDTQTSDEPAEENWAVGTLDADDIATNTSYTYMIVGSEDYSGPNWFKVQFQVGVHDGACGPLGEPAWCMLYPHATGNHASFKHHFTFPGSVYYLTKSH